MPCFLSSSKKRQGDYSINGQQINTEEQLNVPPETRGRRSVKDDILLGTRDANGLVRGCEDTDFLGFGDVSTFPEDIASRIEDQRECCKETSRGQSRRKRQLAISKNIFWEMPVFYTLTDDDGSKFKNLF
uniref:Uncharacterized protein n=1 Tax=Meloidogyne incognita TaxID=6306 RepID=A0A914M7I6_MELIC